MESTAPEVRALKGEIEQLQSGLTAALAKIRSLNGGESFDGHDSVIASAEKMWTEAKRQAQQVGHEIEERPFASALTAFGAGIAIGVLLGGPGHRVEVNKVWG